MKRLIVLFGLLFSGSLLFLASSLTHTRAAQQQPPAFEPKPEDPEDYPDNPGRDDAFYGCTACHGFKIVAAQGFTRERWSETIDIMIERHGAPKLDAKDRKTILDYLEKTFPPKAPGNRGFQNPFLNQ